MTDILNQIDDAIADTIKDSVERNEQRFDLTAGGRVLDDALGGWFSECCAMRWMPASKAPEPEGSAPDPLAAAQALMTEAYQRQPAWSASTQPLRAEDIMAAYHAIPATWIDETHLFRRALTEAEAQTFQRLWLDAPVEALRPESPPCGNTITAFLGRSLVCENSPGHQGPHRQGMTTWTEAESVPDAALEPGPDELLHAHEVGGPYRDCPECPDGQHLDVRPWWKRWLR